MKKPKLIILVKYFFPIKKVSGNLSYYMHLLPSLSKYFDISVVTLNTGKFKEYEKQSGFEIYRVKKPFIINGSIFARKLSQEKSTNNIVFGTGMHKPLMHFFVSFCIRLLTFRKNLFLLQNVLFIKNWQFLLSLYNRLFNDIFCTSETIQNQFSHFNIDSNLASAGLNFDLLDSNIKPILKDKNKIRIGFFGQFIEVKSPIDLIKSFIFISKKYDNLELFLAADNISNFKEKRIIPLISKRKNIIVEGYLDNVYSYMLSCDIVVVPFKTDYGILGLAQTAIDAMALKRVVIGYDSATIRPLISDGEDGFLYKTQDELKKILENLINDKPLMKKIGAAAKIKIKRKFDIYNSARSISEVINNN